MKKNPINTIAVPWKWTDVIIVNLLALILPALSLIFLALLGSFFNPAKDIYNFLLSTSPASQSALYGLGVFFELGLLYLVIKKYNLSFKNFGLAKFKAFEAAKLVFGFYILIIICVWLIFSLISIIAPSININEVQKTGFESASQVWEKMIGFFIIVIAAPVVEEIYYRGFTFAGFIARFGFLSSALFSSLIFSLLHFQLNVGIYTFVLALFLCLMYYKTKSIIPGIILHSVNNFIAYLVIFKII